MKATVVHAEPVRNPRGAGRKRVVARTEAELVDQIVEDVLAGDFASLRKVVHEAIT
jgi:hypothetical protein